MNSELASVIDLLGMLVLDPRSGALIVLLLAAAATDCRSGRIPNWLVLCGALLGLALNALMPQVRVSALSSLGLAMAGMACGLAALLPFYLLRVMGAGDVKLMAMTGAFVGYPTAIWAVLATFLAGGVLALAWAAWKGGLRRAVGNVAVLMHGAVLDMAGGEKPRLTLEAPRSAGTLPYGVAIAAGTIGYLVASQLGLVRL